MDYFLDVAPFGLRHLRRDLVPSASRFLLAVALDVGIIVVLSAFLAGQTG